MRNYLIVAHRTLVDQHVLDEAKECARREPSHFHLVVPMAAPFRQAWTDGEVRAAAVKRLAEGLEAFRRAGLDASGEVGDGRPVEAVNQLLLRGDVEVDEIILSTLPPGPSRWLKWDVPHRMATVVAPIPVHHVTALKASTRI